VLVVEDDGQGFTDIEANVRVLDERDEVHVVMTANHEDALTAVLILVVMLDRIQQVASFDVKHDLFEPDAPLSFERLVRGVIPGEILHQTNVQRCVPNEHTLEPCDCALSCAHSLRDSVSCSTRPWNEAIGDGEAILLVELAWCDVTVDAREATVNPRVAGSNPA
jgi:hypothetical protein